MAVSCLYIIPFIDRKGIFYKFGYSINFNERFYSYQTEIIPPQTKGVKIFRLDLTQEEIYKKEQYVLNEILTDNKIKGFGKETRSEIDISKIENYLKIKVEDFIPIKPLKEQIFQLRDYQEEAIQRFKDKFDTEQSFKGVYCLATGLGKSIIAIFICLYHLEKYPDDNILWITFRNDIVDTQKEAFKKHLGDKFILCNHGTFHQKRLNVKGKVIVVLRQSLLNLPTNLNVQGMIYDECHDAANLDSKNFKKLKELLKTQNLRYRIGFSATPLTNSEKQNKGVVELYGEPLYKYSLVGACGKWLLKPIIEYISYDEDTYIDEIIDIINKQELIYKKGIIWLPSIDKVDSTIQLLKIEGIQFVHNTSKSNSMSTSDFANIKRNCIMLTCDKYTTGFDGINMEFGINCHSNECGNLTVQKIGRFSRDNKEGQQYAYFFQLCRFNDRQFDKLVESICRNLDSIGIDEESEMIHTLNKSPYSRLLEHIIIRNKDRRRTLKDFEELRAKVEARHFHGKSLTRYIQYQNKRIIEANPNLSIIDLIHQEKLKVTKDDCEYFSKLVGIQMKESNNYIKMCLEEKIFNKVKYHFYKSSKIKDACITININDIHDYKKNHRKDIKLPPYYLINGNGFYNDENRDFNLSLELDSIYDDTDF